MRKEHRPISVICELDPEEVTWKNKIDEWVGDEISDEELLEHYPSYLLRIEERMARSVKRVASNLTNRFAKGSKKEGEVVE